MSMRSLDRTKSHRQVLFVDATSGAEYRGRSGKYSDAKAISTRERTLVKYSDVELHPKAAITATKHRTFTEQRSPKSYSSHSADIILRSFQPRVAVFASADTEELIRLKGIYGGFCGLLKPFGENLAGNVIIRDSVGGSKSWNNFGVHFIEFGKRDGASSWQQKMFTDDSSIQAAQSLFGFLPQHRETTSKSSFVTHPSVVDDLVERRLSMSPGYSRVSKTVKPKHDRRSTPSYYGLYLEKLLYRDPMVPHETLSHPVACVIAISSQCSSPIETLRELYTSTGQGIKRVPVWAGNEFLRYYVLVHDEDHDDITKSTALFDQMKRHFGLHCHLLRLRSVECTENEEDSIHLPSCRWLSPEEDLYNIRQVQEGGVNDFRHFLFDTDVAVIKTFVREMITQSILPFMEGRVTTWNDQVASRRRGISGRFMSLSKRWTGFGTSKGSKGSPSNLSGPSSSNYDAVHGFYAPDSPEATMLRLADYAFMIRDWALASSVYEILRADFGDDKAWNYHAAANEMNALSLLLTTQTTTTKSRTEAIDQLLDDASYSYNTRCADSQAAERCLVLAIELYRSRDGPAVGEAARWAERLLELSILSPIVNGLLIERLAVCYTGQSGLGKLHWGSRYRKAALADLLATQVWSTLKRPASASVRFHEASRSYSILDERGTVLPFPAMQELWGQLHKEFAEQMVTSTPLISFAGEDELQDEIEDFDNISRPRNSNGNPAHIHELEGITLMQRLNDPLDQANDGFV
ncbi:hypothetical protein MMC18_007792 [Xylographa bjoerkii]|nr:hypothetical protein [Xylographa bjoerkii]